MRRDRIRPKESAMTGKYYVAETIRQDGIADRWNGSRSNFSLFEAPCNRTRSILSPPLSLSLFLFAHPLSSLSLPTLRRPSAPITESDRVQVASTYFCKNLGMPEARRIRRKARAECTPRYFKRRLSAISRDLIQDRVSGPRHFICRWGAWTEFSSISLSFFFLLPFLVSFDEQRNVPRNIVRSKQINSGSFEESVE